MKITNKNKQRGFTLIELMITVAIMGIHERMARKEIIIGFGHPVYSELDSSSFLYELRQKK